MIEEEPSFAEAIRYLEIFLVERIELNTISTWFSLKKHARMAARRRQQKYPLRRTSRFVGDESSSFKNINSDFIDEKLQSRMKHISKVNTEQSVWR